MIPLIEGRKNAPVKNSGTTVRTMDNLLGQLGLESDALYIHHGTEDPFPLKVPQSFVDRMERGNRDDPLLLQILPDRLEASGEGGGENDPVGDIQALRAPGVIQKYRGRALLMTTSACAAHCRYCFRRHFPYRESALRGERWQKAFDLLSRDTSLEEIILSGGDPLMLSAERLFEISKALLAIPHIKRLRLHTRQPILDPKSLSPQHLHWFNELGPDLIVVIHANHPNELNDEVELVLRQIAASGVTLLNQSVLLKGVNDSAIQLVRLCKRLFECRTLPYYLHQLDPVAGATHFAVSDTEAKKIMAQLREELPGYLVPRLVREKVGATGKLPV